MVDVCHAGFEWAEELVSNDEHMVITILVDDMVVTSQHLAHITHFKAQLREHFEITDLGKLTWLLGLKVV
jgi:hypothetical protein